MANHSTAGAPGAAGADQRARASAGAAPPASDRPSRASGAPTRTRRRKNPFKRLDELEALIEIECQRVAAYSQEAVGEREAALGRALLQRAVSGDEPARAMVAALLPSDVVKPHRYVFHPRCWKPGWAVALPSNWRFSRGE